MLDEIIGSAKLQHEERERERGSGEDGKLATEMRVLSLLFSLMPLGILKVVINLGKHCVLALEMLLPKFSFAQNLTQICTNPFVLKN